MELKKTPEANLESKKPLFFITGLAIALAVVLLAFEWKQYEFSATDLGTLDAELEEEELIPITRQEIQPPPPPPPPPQQIEFEIVEDEEETEEIDIDSEMDEDTETEIRDIVEEEEVVAAPQIFTIVEENAEFPGGYQKMMEYIGNNVKYPQIARETNIQGKVYVQFVVRKNGSITDAKVLRGIGGGCDEEALRVVKKMPKWKPGKQRNQPVDMYFNLPINFTLR